MRFVTLSDEEVSKNSCERKKEKKKRDASYTLMMRI